MEKFIDNCEQGNSQVQKFFASPYHDKSNDTFALIMSDAINGINSLKPIDKNSSSYLGKNAALSVFRSTAQKAVLNTKSEPLNAVLADIISTFEGLPNWGIH